MLKERLDMLVVKNGLAESRSQAQRYIMGGIIRVNDELAVKPANKYPADSRIELVEQPAFVSRGGEKLAAALEAFTSIQIEGKVCADIGASTGGFSDCLLQHGAKKVYAIDVGYGVLHWKLRNDPRVVVMERTNARFVERLPEPIQVVSVDVSFISIKILLPVIQGWFAGKRGDVAALIKPQFEAGRKDAARGEGVIRDPAVHQAVLADILKFADEAGYGILGLIRSPLVGPKGNIEFLAHLEYPGKTLDAIPELIARVIIP